MARIRTIKPEFFRHEKLQDLELEHQELKPMLVFAALWGHCDRNGVFEWKPRQLKLDILPFLANDMAASLALLREAELISCMAHGGKAYGYIPSFREHQRITGKEKDAPSKFPDPGDLVEWQGGNNGETPVKQQGTKGENGGDTGAETDGQEVPPETAGPGPVFFDISAQVPEFSTGNHAGNGGETPVKHPGAQEGKGREGKGREKEKEAAADITSEGSLKEGGGEEKTMTLTEVLALKRSALGLVENPGQVTVLQEICRDYTRSAILEAFQAARLSQVRNLRWVLTRLRGRASPQSKGLSAEKVEEQNRQAVRDFCGVGGVA